MNLETLQPFESGDIAVKNGRKGGIKSGEERRKKKLFKEVVKDILNQKPSKEEIKELKNKYTELDIEDITIRTLLIEKQVKKALNGDTKACDFLVSMSGERPKEGEDQSDFSFFNISLVD